MKGGCDSLRVPVLVLHKGGKFGRYPYRTTSRGAHPTMPCAGGELCLLLNLTPKKIKGTLELDGVEEMTEHLNNTHVEEENVSDMEKKGVGEGSGGGRGGSGGGRGGRATAL